MDDGIRPAVKQDIPALCEIWKSCFSDSEEYIRLFYQNNFERIKALAYFADGKPVSMLHLLDATFKYKNSSQPAKFIYATGTYPEYRKKSYMSAIINYVTEMADKNGYALFLKPSSPSTAAFYKSFGFEAESALNLVTLFPSEKQPLAVYELSFTEYNRMRNAAFSAISYVEWDNAHINWSIEENKYFSGKTLRIDLKGKKYFLLGYPEDNTLIINETDLSVSQLRELSGSLCDIFGTKLIKAYMPDFSCEEGERFTSSLLYNTRVSNPYVNMILI